eukprot:3878180-Prymnesium_polylepis.1
MDERHKLLEQLQGKQIALFLANAKRHERQALAAVARRGRCVAAVCARETVCARVRRCVCVAVRARA